VDGEVHVTDGEEYDRMTEQNQYYPEVIDLKDISKINLLPIEITQQFITDLNTKTDL
jgi:hypothetical protein